MIPVAICDQCIADMVEARHCSWALRKQVLPRFFRPTNRREWQIWAWIHLLERAGSASIQCSHYTNLLSRKSNVECHHQREPISARRVYIATTFAVFGFDERVHCERLSTSFTCLVDSWGLFFLAASGDFLFNYRNTPGIALLLGQWIWSLRRQVIWIIDAERKPARSTDLYECRCICWCWCWMRHSNLDDDIGQRHSRRALRFLNSSITKKGNDGHCDGVARRTGDGRRTLERSSAFWWTTWRFCEISERNLSRFSWPLSPRPSTVVSWPYSSTSGVSFVQSMSRRRHQRTIRDGSHSDFSSLEATKRRNRCILLNVASLRNDRFRKNVFMKKQWFETMNEECEKWVPSSRSALYLRDPCHQ